jgi:hypothetical protein
MVEGRTEKSIKIDEKKVVLVDIDIESLERKLKDYLSNFYTLDDYLSNFYTLDLNKRLNDKVRQILNRKGAIVGLHVPPSFGRMVGTGRRTKILPIYTPELGFFSLGKTLLFDSNDPLLTSHEMAPEIYYELKYEAGHSDEVIPLLIEDIISRYERLLKVVPEPKRRNALAAAIYLTCRGQYVCPVSMKKYPIILGKGGFSRIDEWARKIGEKIRYFSEEMLSNALSKLMDSFGVSENVERRVWELYEKDKVNHPIVRRGYVGGLFLVACDLEGIWIKQKDVGACLGVTPLTIRHYYMDLRDRLEIEVKPAYYKHLSLSKSGTS